jgi:hypothetical protein
MKRAPCLLLVAALGFSGLWCGQDPAKKSTWDGSQSVPVHQLQLRDEFDTPIVPTESYPLPFSSRFTCAPCHDYGVIGQGLHFNNIEVEPTGRPGEPWFWIEKKSGTVLPLSLQGWKGTWLPHQLGLSVWEFALLFGRHMAGGGVLEPEADMMSPGSRWNVSGGVEINCLACHNASRQQSHSEWAKQILRQNFRWAATASSGLGEVGGMASRLPGTWDVFDGPNLDDTEWAVAPYVRYNGALFDSKHRVFFDIADSPEDNRCLVCHSVTPVDKQRMELDVDVHMASGIRCVDCHRNGIDHRMVRGDGEETSAFSCVGCHLGPDLKKPVGPSVGRLGAPFPQHRGLPAVHLERLSCTVCHSGPRLKKETTSVRTSRANRLGIYGIADWSTVLPRVVEPVFFKIDGKKIMPHRLVWPSFWMKLNEDKTIPLRPDEILERAGTLLDSESRVARLLLALFREPELGGTPVLLAGEKSFSLNVDDGLDSAPLAEGIAVEGLSWAVKTESEIQPLIPPFDPAQEMLDIEIENRILGVLEALATYEFAPGKPVLVVEDVVYFSDEGYLGKMENPGEPSPRADLYWLVEEALEPLIDVFDLRTVLALIGKEQSLTEEQVVRVLTVLNQQPNEESGGKEFGYVSGGFLFRLEENGGLKAESHPYSEPVVWPLAHRVRPARQALGINGCRDCHRADSSFFFGKVKGFGPLLTEKVESRALGSFMRLVQPYQRLFGLSFSLRPVFKVVLLVSAVVLGSVLLAFFLFVIGRVSGLVDKGR